MPREVERRGRPSGKDPREGGLKWIRNAVPSRYPKSEPQSTIDLGGDSQSEPLRQVRWIFHPLIKKRILKLINIGINIQMPVVSKFLLSIKNYSYKCIE